MRSRLLVLSAVLLAVLSVAPASADTLTLNVPGIGSSIPVDSFTVGSTQATLTRDIDIYTPQIFLAVTNSTLYPSVTLTVSNPTISTSLPVDVYRFSTAVFAAANLNGVGTTETDTLRYTSVSSFLYSLDVPGIGSNIPVTSISFGANSITMDRPLDVFTPLIFDAVAHGTHFGTADLFVFDPLVSTTNPIGEYIFTDDVYSSASIIPGTTTEADTLTFDRVEVVSSTAAVPEPASLVLFGGGVCLLGGIRRLIRARAKASRA